MFVFFGIVLLTIMVSTFDVQSIKKLNENSFHTWKTNIEFLLHENDLWKNIWAKLLPWEIEFEKIVFEGRIYEHRMFMKKNKLACWTIFLHIVDFLLHYVACVKSVKKIAWDNLCATFEKWHVNNRWQLCQEFYNLKNGGKHLWRKALLCKFTLTNFTWYVIFVENLAFTFLENLPHSLHTLWFCLEPIQMKCP